jgi:ATP-binding protein involved in chromosome partitioning
VRRPDPVLTRRRSKDPDTAAVELAVGAVQDPELHRPLTALGMVRQVTIGRRRRVRVVLALTTQACPMQRRLTEDVQAAVTSVLGPVQVDVDFTVMDEQQRHEVARTVAPDHARTGSAPAPAVYAVASGKGGVGKSSIAANLAVALAAAGKSVGLLDADVWGYSVPQLFGVRRRPIAMEGVMLPVEAHGVRLMSTGFLVEDEAPIVWRGPMLHKALQQFIDQVLWGPLDVLILDLPPGTGDVTLSVLELLPDAALLAVTTPQQAARTVATRVGAMARDTGMPVAGVIENMSHLVCPECGTHSALFGSGGGTRLAQELHVPLLGQVPLDLALREAGDHGVPVVAGSPDSPSALALRAAASALPVVRRSLVGRPLNLTVVNSGP